MAIEKFSAHSAQPRPWEAGFGISYLENLSSGFKFTRQEELTLSLGDADRVHHPSWHALHVSHLDRLRLLALILFSFVLVCVCVCFP